MLVRSDLTAICALERKRNALIADEVQGTGTVDHTPVYPREVARRALPLMTAGGTILTLTYGGATRVMPNYNVMGIAKAALEASGLLGAHVDGDGTLRAGDLVVADQALDPTGAHQTLVEAGDRLDAGEFVRFRRVEADDIVETLGDHQRVGRRGGMRGGGERRQYQ